MLPVNSLAFAFLEATRICTGVLQGQSLAEGALAHVDSAARPIVQDLVYQVLRQHGRGDFILGQLLQKPLAVQEVRCLLLLALYRLESRPQQTHATVDQAVIASGELAGGKFRGLVNAVLRNFLRQQPALLEALAHDPVACYQHPAWWVDQVMEDWPADWQAVLAAGNMPPPMALRCNARRTTPEASLDALSAAGIPARMGDGDALLLDKPLSVEKIPGFAEGLLSVQDPGAQEAARRLAPLPGSRVLDACAAPGGKTAHLLEQNDLTIWALDLKPARCRRIQENLDRLGLQATIKVADCIKRDTWWDGQPFDAILADVPCTASGVVRRHPDAKWLRRPEDIASFAATQARILSSLWCVLKPGGKMLYATCSVFAAENHLQIQAFLRKQPQARLVDQAQLLPNPDRDGFFYALLEKNA